MTVPSKRGLSMSGELIGVGVTDNRSPIPDPPLTSSAAWCLLGTARLLESADNSAKHVPLHANL